MKSPKEYLDFKRKDKGKKTTLSAAQQSLRISKIIKTCKEGKEGK